MACWYILGAGSLATLWAVRLARSGLPVCLLLRNPERLAAYIDQGSLLTLLENGHPQHCKIPAILTRALPQHARLLVACKAYDVKPALDSLPYPPKELILLQNGMGSQQQAAQRYPHTRSFFLSSTEGAYRQSDFCSVWAGQGQNWLGAAEADETPPQWMSEWQHASIPYQWTSAIYPRLWRKLVLNCAINPLTVLHQCRNGQLHQYAEQLEGLCQELQLLLEHTSPASQGEPSVRDQVFEIIKATANNYSSMLQDVQHRRRTEISYLSGYACQAAQQTKLQLPLLTQLHQQLQAHLRQLKLPDH